MTVFSLYHSAAVRNSKSPNQVRLLNAADLLVGTGSFAFHSTLKCRSALRPKNPLTDPRVDPMQLVDELSMIYTATIMCYATFSFAQSRLIRVVLGVGLVGLAVFITVGLHFSVCELVY